MSRIRLAWPQVVASALLLAGCAHTTMRGTVAMKVSDKEGHICMGDNEVKTGDRVAFFVNRCSGGGGRGGRECTKQKVGEGEIVKPLNEHYSIVRALGDAKLEEGLVVEKL